MPLSNTEDRLWIGKPGWSGYAVLSMDDAIGRGTSTAAVARTLGWNVSLGRSKSGDPSDVPLLNLESVPVDTGARIKRSGTTTKSSPRMQTAKFIVMAIGVLMLVGAIGTAAYFTVTTLVAENTPPPPSRPMLPPPSTMLPPATPPNPAENTPPPPSPTSPPPPTPPPPPRPPPPSPPQLPPLSPPPSLPPSPPQPSPQS